MGGEVDMAMTVEDLKGIVPEDQHEDFDALITQIGTHPDPLEGLTDEGFVELLKTKADFRKIHDARLRQGIDSYSEKTLPKLLAEKYAKEHPDETDEQKRIKALEIRSEQADARALKAELTTKAITTATEKGLPLDLVNLAIAADEETTLGNLSLLESAVTADRQGNRKSWLKDNGRKPQKSSEPDKDLYYTGEQLEAMSPAQQAADWDKVQRSLSYIGENERS